MFLKSGSSAGTQDKRVQDGYLIKYDRSGKNEGLAEVLTSRFLDTCALPVRHIKYAPYQDKHGVGCISRVHSDMLNSSGSLVHYLQRVYGVGWSAKYTGLSSTQAYFLLLKDLSSIPNASEYFTYLQLIDALVMNTDRHWNNINIIQGENGNFYFSPLFDFGASLAVASLPEESLNMCLSVLKNSCSWLVPNHFEALRLVNSVYPYCLSFKKDTIRVTDLYKMYDRVIVHRALLIIESNLKAIGIDKQFRYI